MKRVIIIVLAALVLLIGLIFFTYPHIKINGEKENIVELNSTYEEKNAVVKKIFGKGKILTTTDKVDTKKVGEYKITYKTKYLFFTVSETKTVKVVDKVAPEIKLKGKNEVYVCPEAEYKEDGFIATDDYDGDITNKVKTEYSGNEVTYKVIDTSGNETSIIRKVIKQDKEKPVITLNGKQNITLIKGANYKDAGAKVIDNCDSNIELKTDGSVDTKKIGTYKITYSAIDSSKNEEKVTRTIKVIEKKSESISKATAKSPTSGSAIVYLTFDDGPSPLTSQVLDILKSENVTATFFVTGKYSSLDYIIKREHDEGHTVALHTYSHDYRAVYASEDAYFNDLNKVSDRVERLTGVKSKIIRFPGGSSNTVSKFNPGIMSRLVKKVTDKGYKYFDWNVSSGDAGNTTKASKVYSNVINGISPSKVNIVLMHDAADKTYTVNALKDIIQDLKKAGYKFASINSSTPQVTHGVNN